MSHRRAARSDGTSWAALGSATLAIIGLVSVVCLVLGATALAVGVTRPTTRATTVSRPWTTATTFGWSGTGALPTVNNIYPDGQVQSPQPVFLRLLKKITVTADVTTSGAVRAGNSPLTLRATLGDSSGWSRTWALDRTDASAGSTAHLSAPLDLNNLYWEMAWNQVATGVANPITLTLSVDGEPAGVRSPHLAFSLDQLLFKPVGPLTTTTNGSVADRSRTVDTVRLAGKSATVTGLREGGAVLVGAGLVLGASATLADRLRRRQRRRGRPAAPSRVAVPSQRQEIEETAEEVIAL